MFGCGGLLAKLGTKPCGHLVAQLFPRFKLLDPMLSTFDDAAIQPVFGKLGPALHSVGVGRGLGIVVLLITRVQGQHRCRQVPKRLGQRVSVDAVWLVGYVF